MSTSIKNTGAKFPLLRRGTAEGIRTPDLLVRSQSLYPTELQPRTARGVPLDSLVIIAQSPPKSKRFFPLFQVFLEAHMTKPGALQAVRRVCVETAEFRNSAAEHLDHEAGRTGGADHAGHVGAHSVHEQEVGGVLLLAHGLGHTGGHGHGGHAGRADQRIDLAAGDSVHHVAQNQTAGSGQQEGGQAQHNDAQSLGGQEGAAHGLEAHGQAQGDGDDVDEGVLGGVGQALGNAALTEQVAQHEHTDQGGGVGHQQNDEDSHGDGEDDLLGLGHLAQLSHLHLTGLLGGQGLHQRRLDHGNQRHIGVCRDGDGGQQPHSQLGSRQNGGRAVGAADDADGGGLSGCEAQDQSHQEGGEDAQLSGSAQQQGHGVGQQRTKVGHCANSHEDNRRIDGPLDALIEHPHEADGTTVGSGVIDRLGKQAGDGQVCQQHTEGDGNHQQRLIALADAHVQQHTGDEQHHKGPPVKQSRLRVGKDSSKAGTVGNRKNYIF